VLEPSRTGLRQPLHAGRIMSSSIFAAVQKDLGAQSRDLTALVKQVKGIMPQFSDDIVCEALVQSDEDVTRAVELLLRHAIASKAARKKK